MGGYEYVAGGICSALGPIVWEPVGGNSHTKMHWRAMYPTRGVDLENIAMQTFSRALGFLIQKYVYLENFSIHKLWYKLLDQNLKQRQKYTANMVVW